METSGITFLPLVRYRHFQNLQSGFFKAILRLCSLNTLKSTVDPDPYI
jgi:hypothetical protein